MALPSYGETLRYYAQLQLLQYFAPLMQRPSPALQSAAHIGPSSTVDRAGSAFRAGRPDEALRSRGAHECQPLVDKCAERRHHLAIYLPDGWVGCRGRPAMCLGIHGSAGSAEITVPPPWGSAEVTRRATISARPADTDTDADEYSTGISTTLV